MPVMGYRDSGGHFAVRYVPAFGGWRGKPGRIGRIGRTGRRGGSHSGRSPPEQHSSTQLHVSRARHDRRVCEPSTGGDGIRLFLSLEFYLLLGSVLKFIVQMSLYMRLWNMEYYMYTFTYIY